MSNESLSDYLPIPPDPKEPGNLNDWPDIENNVSTSLPLDYKVFINNYGTGRIGNLIWVLNPFTKNQNLNLLKQIEVRLDALRVLSDQFSDKVPYPLFPFPGGLLPWGFTDNGDVLYWITNGSPNDWIVVINESRAPEYEDFEMSMTEFIMKLLSQKINSAIIPFEFLDTNLLFEPY